MKSRMVGRLVIVAVAIVFMVAMAIPAGAGPALTDKVKDFQTFAMDADGCFKVVNCSHAHLVTKNGIARETYNCEFVPEGAAGFGTPAIPDSTMVWDAENTANLEGWENCTVPIEPPYRWYSDVRDILDGDLLCWMYTTNFRMVITPSGNVNVTVVYDPPVFEGPDCP